MDAWATLLSEAVAMRSKVPAGKGWKQFDQIKTELGCEKAKARSIIADLMSKGRLERFEGCEDQQGRLVRRAWYRPL